MTKPTLPAAKSDHSVSEQGSPTKRGAVSDEEADELYGDSIDEDTQKVRPPPGQERNPNALPVGEPTQRTGGFCYLMCGKFTCQVKLPSG